MVDHYMPFICRRSVFLHGIGVELIPNKKVLLCLQIFAVNRLIEETNSKPTVNLDWKPIGNLSGTHIEVSMFDNKTAAFCFVL